MGVDITYSTYTEDYSDIDVLSRYSNSPKYYAKCEECSCTIFKRNTSKYSPKKFYNYECCRCGKDKRIYRTELVYEKHMRSKNEEPIS